MRSYGIGWPRGKLAVERAERYGAMAASKSSSGRRRIQRDVLLPAGERIRVKPSTVIVGMW